MSQSNEKRFKVALSFPGEKRAFVEKVAEKLAEVLGRESVFYDKYYEAELARKNLDKYLGEIYGLHADLVAPFFCAEYTQKKWCRLEWDYIRVILFELEDERVMPFRFDDTEIKGYLKIDGFVPIGKRSPEQMAELILQRLSGKSLPVSDLMWENNAQLKEYYSLPSTSGLFFGRDDIINQLDEAWSSPTINLCTIIAPGGVGKTSIVKAWLDHFRESDNHGARAIYTHSFYHQGAIQSRETEELQSSGQVFLTAALEWFGDAQPDFGTPINKAERLARLMQERRTLLILDGLEPLQHQVDEFRGKIEDQGILYLLNQLTRVNSGLCIVTTRVALADFQEFKVDGKNRHLELVLPNLSSSAGIAVLRKIGVDGEQSELRQAVEEVEGHALSLILLGNYLRSQFNGNIKCRDRLGPLAKESKYGTHANHVMKSYEEILSGKPELSLLYVLGLFDRPAERDAINSVIETSSVQRKGAARHLWNGLRGFPGSSFLKAVYQWVGLCFWNIYECRQRHSAFMTLTSPFRTSPFPDYDDALLTLIELGLVSRPDPQSPEAVDCHPLVRQHFGEAFKRDNYKGWQEAHSRLFEFFSSIPKKEQPATLSEMAPLYAAVEHGCRAGRYTEAGIIYHHRMLQGAVYSCNHLGQLQADLALLTYFFHKTWCRPAPKLALQEKALLLHWAGILLLTLGRGKEGVTPTKDAIKIAINVKMWWMAATGSYYLCLAHMMLGDLVAAKASALEGIKYGLISKEPNWLIGPYAALGHCLHKMGCSNEAKAAFQSSEQAMHRLTPNVPILHSVWSYWCCELLLDIGDFNNAKIRGEHSLKYAPEQFRSSQGFLLDKAVSELALARANLMLERQREDLEFQESKKYFVQAFESLRSVNHQWLMPEALLGRSELHQIRGMPEQVTADLDETRRLVNRSGFKIQAADLMLRSAQLFYSQNDTIQALEQLDAVERESVGMGYRRLDVQISLLRAKISHFKNEHEDCMKHFAKAKQSSRETGFHQWLIELTENELFG